jgi:hypothetical protein
MQVRGEGGVGVGADVDGAIIIIILGKRDPLGCGKLLFQVMSDGLLLLLSEGGGTLAHACLIHGLACGSHSSDESLLLSVRSSGRGVVFLPLGGSSLLPVDGGEVRVIARHSRQDGGGGRRRALGLGQR